MLTGHLNPQILKGINIIIVHFLASFIKEMAVRKSEILQFMIQGQIAKLKLALFRVNAKMSMHSLIANIV